MFLQLPWFEKAVDFDVRAKPRNIASLTGTKGEPFPVSLLNEKNLKLMPNVP